jgi:hypothetical protein
MAVTQRGGGPVTSAAVGDALELHFAVQGKPETHSLSTVPCLLRFFIFCSSFFVSKFVFYILMNVLWFSTMPDANSPYEIFVRELVAKDGNDQNEILLLDASGMRLALDTVASRGWK